MTDPRPCPACEADNTADASFCWRCYAPFTARVPVGATAFPAAPGAPATGVTPPPVAPGPMATPPWQQTGGHALSELPEPIPVSRWSGGRLIRLLVSAALLVGGFLAWRAFTSGPFPESIRGFDRLDSEPAEAFEKAVSETGKGLGISMDGAVYGKGDAMGFMAIVAERTGSADALDDAFLEPFPVDRPIVGGYEEYEVQGGSFRCFSYRAEVAGAGCFWLDDATVGLVWVLDAAVPRAVNVTTAVRTAVT